MSIVMLLDVSAAFSTTDHEISLLTQLWIAAKVDIAAVCSWLETPKGGPLLSVRALPFEVPQETRSLCYCSVGP